MKKASKETKTARIIKVILIVIFTVVLLLAVISDLVQIYFYLLSRNEIALTSPTQACSKNEYNVAVVKIHGSIFAYEKNLGSDAENELVQTSSDIVSSEKIVSYLEELNDKDNIKAIIIDIDSNGGSPAAGEEISNALKMIKKPTYAVVRDACFSAAYLAATGAKKIYATSVSQLGSIGVTMSYLDYSKQTADSGVVYQQISAGKFKDAGNPDKELTKEEKKMLENYVLKVKDAFVALIAKNRNLSVEDVQNLADGSPITAFEAKDKGLIDEIGDMTDVKARIKNELKIEPKICPVE